MTITRQPMAWLRDWLLAREETRRVVAREDAITDRLAEWRKCVQSADQMAVSEAISVQRASADGTTTLGVRRVAFDRYLAAMRAGLFSDGDIDRAMAEAEAGMKRALSSQPDDA